MNIATYSRLEVFTVIHVLAYYSAFQTIISIVSCLLQSTTYGSKSKNITLSFLLMHEIVQFVFAHKLLYLQMGCAHQILACTDGIVHTDTILTSYKVLLLDGKHPTSYLFIVQNIRFLMLVTRLMPCMHYLMHEQFHVSKPTPHIVCCSK